MKRLTKFIASLALGVLLLFVLLRHFNTGLTMESVRKAHPGLLMLGFMLMVSAYLLRGARWQIWERSLIYWDSLRLILIGFMGNNVLPGRLGEILRAHCAAAKTDDDRGRTAFLASIAAERILDGLILSVFGLAAISLVHVDRRLEGVLILVSFAFACLTSGLVLGTRYQHGIGSIISTVSRWLPRRLCAFVQEKAAQFLDGLRPLGTVRRMVSAVAATSVIWGIEVASYYCFGLAVWSGMSVRTALLCLVVVNFASLIPLTMGGIGTIDAAGPLFLISSGVAPPIALAMVLLQHAAQYLFTTTSGGILYLAGGFHRLPLARPKTAAPRRSAPATGAPGVEQTRSSLGKAGASAQLRPPAQGQIQISIVIPVYNEQARLPRTVSETIHWCSTRNFNFELIIVDDGSRDDTLAIGRMFEKNDARVRTLACPHLGKGAAVRTGVLNARGRFIFFMDADLATPLDELLKLLAAVEARYDVAIGSRVVRRQDETEVRTSFHRRLIGRSFAFFVRLIGPKGIDDTQCGFKMFRREAATAIFSRQKTRGFAFDVEILFIAQRLSLSIAEIPVNWVGQPGSKVSLVTDSIRMLWDISRLRRLHRKFETRPSPNEERQFAEPTLPGPDIRAIETSSALSALQRPPADDERLDPPESQQDREGCRSERGEKSRSGTNRLTNSVGPLMVTEEQ